MQSWQQSGPWDLLIDTPLNHVQPENLSSMGWVCPFQLLSQLLTGVLGCLAMIPVHVLHRVTCQYSLPSRTIWTSSSSLILLLLLSPLKHFLLTAAACH